MGVLTILTIRATPCFRNLGFQHKAKRRERAERFIIGIGETSRDSEAILTNPSPIAGLVIGIMGTVLVVEGVFPLASSGKIPSLAVGIGALFFVIGAGMVSTRWLGSSRSGEKTGI